MKAFLILLLVSVAAAEFHQPVFMEELRGRPGAPRIIQGSPAVNGQFPHQAFILTTSSSGGRSACGGSLISTRWVLTAAHCVQGVSSQIHLGSVSYASSPVVVSTNNLRPHPNYNPNNLNNDIALIGLTNPVTETNNIRVIPFARDPSQTFQGQIPTVSGFGLTSNSGGVSPTLNYVNVKVISNSECAGYYGSIIVSSTICVLSASSNPQQGTCNGDSGGPLVLNITGVRTQIGVVSFGSSAGCTSSAPNGFVRPTHFTSWINSVAGI